jgi:hypothetical protein
MARHSEVINEMRGYRGRELFIEHFTWREVLLTPFVVLAFILLWVANGFSLDLD